MIAASWGGMVDKNQGGLVVWRWEGKREEGWFWFVFDRSQTGLGFRLGWTWALGGLLV